MINYRDHIQSDFQIMLGKPVIKGTRITVELIIRKLFEGATTSDILVMYPLLRLDDVRACLIYTDQKSLKLY